jgi:hypothetical protein
VALGEAEEEEVLRPFFIAAAGKFAASPYFLMPA